MLWFSAPCWLNRTLEGILKPKRTTKLWIEQLHKRSLDFSVYTHSENVYVAIDGLGFVQRKQEVESEQRDGRMGDGRQT